MSDGAAVAVVMSEDRAKELDARPLARFVAYATAGCRRKRWDWTSLRDSKSAQARRADSGSNRSDRTQRSFRGPVAGRDQNARLDLDKVNVNGGAIAWVIRLLYRSETDRLDLARVGTSQWPLWNVTMCVGGGMGAAGSLRD